jgi:tRNA pseudouridine55 synthase
MSSHKVISILREAVGQKKIGHTGTLDPRATGLLIICLGRATKIAQFLSDLGKTYEAEITLGACSTTFDSEGVLDDTGTEHVPDLTEEKANRILEEFKGKIRQQVPAYSAVKVDGKRLYRLARQGTDVRPPQREIEIKDINLTKLDLPRIYCTVSCSKGTYIRSLANDIGERIGCGGYLSGLRRIRVGSYLVDDALKLNEIKYFRQAGILKRHIIPIESVLPFPSIKVDANFSPGIISGRSPSPRDIIDISGEFRADELITLKDHTGRAMAVGKAEVGSTGLKEFKGDDFFTYVRVLN